MKLDDFLECKLRVAMERKESLEFAIRGTEGYLERLRAQLCDAELTLGALAMIYEEADETNHHQTEQADRGNPHAGGKIF